ncbi:CRISPR-associated protein Cas4 [Spirillospora sp. CA-128828]|uniref:CRISPR-associated protein Cas4 n=1 Tax=Spirillospora sp. CA-128828 TaxID=3240033 RepID=UPI003D94632B
MTSPTVERRTTADLLLEWDRRRPRSLQTEFGMSELGGCRRRAGYRFAGVAPTDAAGSVQAVMGTVLHEAVADVLRQMQAEGLIPTDALIEHEVTFAGLLGHLDLFIEPEVTDTKSTSQRNLDKLRVNGPYRSHLWQTHAYAAALIAEGRTVRRINIDYVARDTGKEWRWSGPFEARHVKDALTWVTEVRQTELEFLPRDYDPTGPFCKGCPFFTVCWDGHVIDRDERSVLFVEDPDAAEWVDKLTDARARKRQAEADEKTAKGALDALRPNDEGSADVVLPSVEHALRFTVTNPERIDADQIRQDYKAAGRKAPLKPQAKPTVRLDLVAPEDSQ